MRARTACALLVLVAGCGASHLTATGTIRHPPAFPIAAYPHVVVVSGHMDYEVAAARTLARAISQGPGRVWLLSTSDFERDTPPRVPRGRGTVVVGVEGQLHQRGTSGISTASIACGAGTVALVALFGHGADVDCPPVVAEGSETQGGVIVWVRDAPTWEVLYQRRFDGPLLRGVAIEIEEQRAIGADLGERIAGVVDIRRQRIDVELLSIADARVRRMLERMRHGDWERGRRALERVRSSRTFRSWSREERARLLYDLAQARRFGRNRSPVVAVEDARRAVDEAVALHPLAELQELRRELDDQHEVAVRMERFLTQRRRHFELAGGAPPE